MNSSCVWIILENSPIRSILCDAAGTTALSTMKQTFWKSNHQHESPARYSTAHHFLMISKVISWVFWSVVQIKLILWCTWPPLMRLLFLQSANEGMWISTHNLLHYTSPADYQWNSWYLLPSHARYKVLKHTLYIYKLYIS